MDPKIGSPDDDAQDAADGSCAGEAVSLLEERARREKEAKLARKRGAFSDLFACGKSASSSSSSPCCTMVLHNTHCSWCNGVRAMNACSFPVGKVLPIC